MLQPSKQAECGAGPGREDREPGLGNRQQGPQQSLSCPSGHVGRGRRKPGRGDAEEKRAGQVAGQARGLASGTLECAGRRHRRPSLTKSWREASSLLPWGACWGTPSPDPGLFSLGSPQEERPASTVPGFGHLRCHLPTPQPQQARLQPAHLGLCLTREGLHWHTFRWSHYVLTASHPVPKSGRPLGNRAGPEAGGGSLLAPRAHQVRGAAGGGYPRLRGARDRPPERAEQSQAGPHCSPSGPVQCWDHATEAGSTEPGVREGQGRWHLVAIQSPLLPVLTGGTASDSRHPRVRIPFTLPSL